MENKKIGVWIIGAKGNIASFIFVGVKEAVNSNLNTGLITMSSEFEHVPFPPLYNLIFGGVDIDETGLYDKLNALNNQELFFNPGIIVSAKEYLNDIENRISAGIQSDNKSIKDNVEYVSELLEKFKSANALDKVVAVNLLPPESPIPEFLLNKDLTAEEFENLTGDVDCASIPASVIYTYSAIKNNCSLINFTSSCCEEIPFIKELAKTNKLILTGRDGKTGETLLKTVLAPMFKKRGLKVESWSGFNMLGNNDGKMLCEGDNKLSKLENKDKALNNILNTMPDLLTRIEYVKSFGDRKTAIDFINFRGFLNIPMKLQFVWEGCDSALAAPLIIDMIRFAVFAEEKNEILSPDCFPIFFKQPVNCKTYDFYDQFESMKNFFRKYNYEISL